MAAPSLKLGVGLRPMAKAELVVVVDLVVTSRDIQKIALIFFLTM